MTELVAGGPVGWNKDDLYDAMRRDALQDIFSLVNKKRTQHVNIRAVEIPYHMYHLLGKPTLMQGTVPVVCGDTLQVLVAG